MSSMTEEVRVYTVEEAEALLPRITPAIEEAQVQARHIRALDAELRDMITVYGKEVADDDHEHNPEFAKFMAKRSEHVTILQAAITELAKYGIEMKDPEIGLIDFYAESGDDLVYLCWHLGEDRIRYWHTLEGGFAGRQEIPGIDLMEP